MSKFNPVGNSQVNATDQLQKLRDIRWEPIENVGTVAIPPFSPFVVVNLRAWSLGESRHLLVRSVIDPVPTESVDESSRVVGFAGPVGVAAPAVDAPTYGKGTLQTPAVARVSGPWRSDSSTDDEDIQPLKLYASQESEYLTSSDTGVVYAAYWPIGELLDRGDGIVDVLVMAIAASGSSGGSGDCCCCPEPHVSVTACCPCLPPIVCVTAPGEDDESDTDDISSLGELSESGASYTVSVLCQSGNSITLTLNAMVNPARPGVCMFRVTSTCDPEWEAWIDLPCDAFQSMDDGTSPFLAETAVTVPCEDCPETLLIRWPRLIKCLVCSTCFGLPVRLCLLVTFTTAAGFTYRNTIRLKWSLTEKAWLPEDHNTTTFIYGTGETETTVTHDIRVVPDAMGCKLLVFVNAEYEAREYTIPPESCTSWSFPFDVDIPPNLLESFDEQWTLSPMFCDELCVIAPATCLDDYPCITATDTLYATAGPVPGMFCTMTLTDEPATPVDGVWTWEITGPEGITTVSLECRYGRNEGGNFVADDAAPPILVLVQTGCGVPGAEAVLIFDGGCTGDDFVISVGLYNDNTCCEGMGFPSLEITITNVAP